MVRARAEELLASLPKPLWNDARRAADALRSARQVHIATHIDADGISAAAIAKRALDGLELRADVSFHKKLDDEALRKLSKQELTWCGSPTWGAAP